MLVFFKISFGMRLILSFFHEFFDLFDQVNCYKKSSCYKNHKVKPKFGPYDGPYSTCQ